VGVGAWSPLRSAPCPRGAAAGFSPGARRRRLSPGGGSLPARGPRRAAGHRFPVAHDLGFKILFYEGCSVGSPSADSVLSRIRPAAPPGSSPWRMAGIDTTHPKTSITF
jgi:hypothetical protein